MKVAAATALKDKNGAQPTPAEISTSRLSAVTYCQSLGKADQDSKISESAHA